jgi:AcrR family transcriptional regulator
MTGMSDVAAPGRPPDGLRERKKARTRASIREHALRLFREHGYPTTTVEQISAAAEVSPATFFRYFPTKEDVVLQDDMELFTLDALEAQPPELGPIAAFRAAAAESLTEMTAADRARLTETTHLAMSVPEIRARALDELIKTMDMIAVALAERAGRPADDFAVRTMTGAVIGVIMSVTVPSVMGNAPIEIGEMFTRIDQALALLEAGLPL